MYKRLVLSLLSIVLILILLLFISYHFYIDNRELKKEVGRGYKQLIRDTKQLIYAVERTNLQQLLETEQGKGIINDYRSRFIAATL
jgi:CHASE3 domain sensor protein